MNTLLKLILTGFLQLSVLVICYAQESPDKQFGELNILAPNAASLGKNVEYPVNLHTGIPDISIPLYTIKEGPLQFPISVSYNASGVKVSEVASWVGLGWTLNANGVISRAVRGLADEKSTASSAGGVASFYKANGYSNYLLKPDDHGPDDPGFANGLVDGEPDLFFFNFNGYSGRFVLREDKTALIIPHQNIRVEAILCDPNEDCSTDTESLRSWKVTTPDGVKYYFGMSLDEITYGSPAIERTHMVSERNAQTISRIISAWYLYKVESPDGKSVITFQYESEQYGFSSLALGGSLYNNLNVNEEKVLVKNNVDGTRLKSIHFTQGEVEFNTSNEPRLDLGGYMPGGTGQHTVPLFDGVNTGAFALAAIEIRSGADYCKRFDFKTGYFVANHLPLTGPLVGRESDFGLKSHRRRLKLMSIQERSCNGDVILPKTEFEYDESNPLPSTLSFGVDHWGFYNGSNNNQWLIPPLSLDGGNTYGSGANREANSSFMGIGTLMAISHPTGGFTKFVYGVDNVTVRPTGTYPENRVIGGRRIQEINKYDRNSNLITSKKFEYPAGVMLFGVPTYITLMRHPILTLSGSTTISENGCRGGNSGAPPYNFAFSSASVHPLRTTLGSHKGYEIVKVVQGDGGYSVYTYNVTQAPDISRDVSVRFINNQQCTGFEPVYPPVPENHPVGRGDLLLEKHYANGDIESRPLKELSYEYEYEVDPIGVHGIIVGILGEPGRYTGPCEYQVKSSYRAKETRIEKTRERNTDFVQEVKTVINYSKKLFNKPTSTALYETISGVSQPVQEVSTIYVKDLSPCNDDPENRIAEYQTDMAQVYANYQDNLDKCKTVAGRAAICDDLQGCAGVDNPCGSEFACRTGSYLDYRVKANEIRINYTNSLIDAREIDCLNSLTPVQNLPYQAILDLNKENFLVLPVESSEWRHGKLIKSSLINYASQGGKVFVDNVQQMDIGAPLMPSSFNPVYIANDGIVKDVGYNVEPEVNYKYEAGRLVEVHNRTSVTSYIWDEVNDQILVKGENIAIGDLKSAYLSSLNSGTFGSPGFETAIRSAAGVSMVTTYQHKNLVGMVAVTDPNNMTSTYEYDDLGRLKIVKDDQGNIVKYYDYQFNLKR